MRKLFPLLSINIAAVANGAYYDGTFAYIKKHPEGADAKTKLTNFAVSHWAREIKRITAGKKEI